MDAHSALWCDHCGEQSSHSPSVGSSEPHGANDKGIDFIFYHSSAAFLRKYNLDQMQTSLELRYGIAWVEIHLSKCAE